MINPWASLDPGIFSTLLVHMSYANPDQPAPSDYQQLIFIADALAELGPDGSPSDMVRVFGDYKKRFLAVMTNAPDVFPYLTGWIGLAQLKVDEAHLQQEPDLFAKLVMAVEQSLTTFPYLAHASKASNSR